LEALVEILADGKGMANPEQLDVAREFDIEIERAANNPTLRSVIQSLSVIGKERQVRAVALMHTHPELGIQRVQNHRDLLAAFRTRDADLVEEVFRRQAIAGMNLLLDELD
jgi:DNA-binding GntR family transcriptional regulator